MKKKGRGAKRGRVRAAQNMRLKCNVLERKREKKRESRASHAVRGNCTLAECGENKEETAADTLSLSPPF